MSGNGYERTDRRCLQYVRFKIISGRFGVECPLYPAERTTFYDNKTKLEREFSEKWQHDPLTIFGRLSQMLSTASLNKIAETILLPLDMNRSKLKML